MRRSGWLLGFWCGAGVVSALGSVYFLFQSRVPMIAELYAQLCHNQPECYPEAGDLLCSVALGFAALVAFVFCIRPTRASKPGQHPN